MKNLTSGLIPNQPVASAVGVFQEIKAGGVEGCLGLDQINWGGKGGAIYEIWKIDPCCGPPDPIQALECLVTWYCLGFCSFSKMYARALDQPCGVVNHIIFPYCCFPCSVLFLRYNIRKKNGVKGNLLGDAVCLYFLGPCAFCQELRAVPRDDWTLCPLSSQPTIQALASPMKFMR